MSLYIGSDHAGFPLKEALVRFLRGKKKRFVDLSPVRIPGDDYPLVAHELTKLVKRAPHHKGILLCGTGIGMDIAANRIKGIRAALVHSSTEARLAREHDDANVLVLGGRILSPSTARHAVCAWLDARPSTAKRHLRRIHEIDT